MQLGFAAVTESNYGDMTVKLKRERKRGFDEIISALRGEVKAKKPQLDIESPRFCRTTSASCKEKLFPCTSFRVHHDRTIHFYL